MKETKNTPQLRFSEFDDEWEEKKLNNYLEVSTEKNFDNLFTKENVLSVSGEFGVVNQIAFQGRSFAGASLTNYKISDLESVIYTKSPLNATPYGIIKANKFEKGIVSVLYAVYKTNNSDSKFIQDYFNLDERLNNYLRPLISKGAKNTINVSDLEALEGIVTFPSLSEQQKIGVFLSHVDSLIQAKTKKLESLKAVKKSLLQKCFPKAGEKVPEMRFAGFSGDWEEKEFIELVSRESKTKISDENNPCVEYEDVTPEIGILNNDVYKKKVRKTGISFDNKNILYGKLRPYLHNWLKPNFEGVAVGDWWVLEPNNVDRDFLYRLIQTKEFDDIANQSSGSKMPRADWNLISHSTFSVPMNIEEQQKIGQFFSNYDSLISAQQKEINKLKYIKKSLLQKMFI